MAGLLRHLRTHPWQRRLLTLGVTTVLSATAALLFYEPIRDWQVLRNLTGDDPQAQREALTDAVALAVTDEDFRAKLNARLDTADDRTFILLMRVLQQADAWYVDSRPGEHLDRQGAIQLGQLQAQLTDPTTTRIGNTPAGRANIVAMVLQGRRDNAHVRRVLTAAASDPAPRVRAQAARLAGLLTDADILARLIADTDATVAETACLAAAFRPELDLTDALTARLDSENPKVSTSAAFALAQPARLTDDLAARLAEMVTAADEPLVRDRMLHVVLVSGHRTLRSAAASRAQATITAGKHPAAMEIVAATEPPDAPLPDAVAAELGRIISTVLAADSDLTQGQAIASLQAAARREAISANQPTRQILQKLWGPSTELLMVYACRALAAEVTGRPDATQPTAHEAFQLLAAAVDFAPATTAPSRRQQLLTTPVASAEAAIAAWQIKPAPTEEPDVTASDLSGEDIIVWKPNPTVLLVEQAASSEHEIAADWISWRAARMDARLAFWLGLRLLPSPESPWHLRVHNAHARSAGTMLLALSARTPEQAQRARQQIAANLKGTGRGGELDPHVRASHHCALLALGQDQYSEEVWDLLTGKVFPKRRALTALLAAGDRRAVDWLVANSTLTDASVIYFLVNVGMAEVLEVFVPELGRFDVVAPADLRGWQLRQMQLNWLYHRDQLPLKSLRPGSQG